MSNFEGEGSISIFTVHNITDPRVPAFEGAPLYQDTKPAASGTATGSESAATVGAGETGDEGDTQNGSSSGQEEQQQSADSAQDQDQLESTTTSTTPFPVVVFSHGLSAMRTISSSVCYQLASHGFVVASMDHRYVCTGRQLKSYNITMSLS